jgi:hypothetical protein
MDNDNKIIAESEVNPYSALVAKPIATPEEFAAILPHQVTRSVLGETGEFLRLAGRLGREKQRDRSVVSLGFHIATPGFPCREWSTRTMAGVSIGPVFRKRETPPQRGFREVGATGLEPVTSSLSSWRSPN